MKIGEIDTDQRVVIVAEIGNNHEGNRQLAERLIHLAAEAGADAVKFQAIEPEHLVQPADQARLAQLQRFALGPQDHEHLARIAETAGLLFLSTPFSLNAVGWLNDLVPAFKIASGDLDFDPLLKAVAATGKPVILSTGMSDTDDIAHAKQVLHSTWAATGAAPGLALLHCVSAYPTPPEHANLAAIRAPALQADAVGYSDHTQGIDIAAISVAAGARIVEKHFTLDKQHSDFRDHQLSADPEDMRQLVQRIRDIEKFLGNAQKQHQPSEQAMAKTTRRAIVARRDLAAGQTITLDDLDWLRPASGLSPRQTSAVLGRQLTTLLARGEPVTADILR